MENVNSKSKFKEMDFKEIKESLLQVVKLVECFEKDSYIIDKEIALDKIRYAYELLRFGENKPSCSTQSTVEAAVATTLICEQAEDNQVEEEPEVEVEFILPDEEEEDEESEESDEPTSVVEQPLEQSEVAEESTEPKEEAPDVADEQEQTEEVVFEDTEETEEVEEPTQTEEPEQESEEKPEPEEVESEVVETTSEEVAEEVAEQIAESEPEQTTESEQPSEPTPEEQSTPEEQPEVEQTPEPKATRPHSGVFEQSLFGNDEQWSRPQQSRRKIMALYGEVEPMQEVKQEAAEPVKVEVPHVETLKAEAAEEHSEQVLGETIESAPTIGDTILKQRSVAETAPVESLRKAISIADRFMLIRDLFGGDVDMYEEAIDTLDTTDNFDDCIIYITESFSWRPSSEGAKLIVDLLQRKFR